jgi:hypothetical protein
MKSSMTNQPGQPVWKNRAMWLGLILALVILCVAAAQPESIRGQNDDNAPSLVGTWQVTVTSGDGSAPFQSLVTYGVLTGVDGSIPPSIVTPGHGAWVRTGAQKFRFTVREFIFDPDGSILGTPGRYTANITEDLKFERGGQDHKGEWIYKGVWTGVILDPAGNVLFPINGTSQAERIVVAE